MFPDADWLATTIVPSLPSVPPSAPLDQFTLHSPLGPSLVAFLQLRGTAAFVVVHLVVLVLLVIVVGVLVVRRHGGMAAGLTGAAFVGSSTAVVLLAWVGSYDVFTVGFLSVLVVARDRRLAAATGFLLAFAAFEQSVFVIAALAALSVVGIGAERLRLAWAAGALVLGRAVLEVWLRANDVTHGRGWFLRETGVSHLLGQFVDALPWLVVTGFGATLLPVVVAVAGLPSVRARVVVVAVLLAALVPTALSLDQTRVFAILTWPVVMALVLDHADRNAPTSIRRLATATLILAAIVPGIVVWEGRAQLATHHLWRAPWRWVRNP